MQNNQAYNYMIKLLTKKEYCRYQLVQKLSKKGFDKKDILEALQFAIKKKYVCDQRYTESFIRDKVLARYGENYIVLHLKMNRISTDIIENYLEKLDINWKIVCLDYCIFKKFHLLDLQDISIKNRIYSNCLKRGFKSDQILYAIVSMQTQVKKDY